MSWETNHLPHQFRQRRQRDPSSYQTTACPPQSLTELRHLGFSKVTTSPPAADLTPLPTVAFLWLFLFEHVEYAHYAVTCKLVVTDCCNRKLRQYLELRKTAIGLS